MLHAGTISVNDHMQVADDFTALYMKVSIVYYSETVIITRITFADKKFL